jgi:hypothetical protein
MSRRTTTDKSDSGPPAPDDYHRAALDAGARCLEAALDGSRRGWSMLIVCPPDHVGVGRTHGRGCSSPGKSPWGAWKEFQTRRATEAELQKRWKDLPNANVGMALGPVSGLIAVDVDGATGEAMLAEVSGGDLPETLEFATGGGKRLLYAIPAGVKLRPTHRPGGQKHEGFSLLGEGAQSVVPPSRHASGRVYAWRPGHGPGEIQPAPAPAWVVRQMGAEGRKAPARAQSNGETIPEGRRNNHLASLGGTMRQRGMEREEILAGLQAVNERRCDPPLDEAEVEGIAASVSRYEPADDTALEEAYARATQTVAIDNAPPAPDPVPDAPHRNGKVTAETGFPPSIPCSALKAADPDKLWLWRPYLAPETIALLSAFWKSGKTTLLAHLARALEADGTFCGSAVRAGRVLYVSEEGEARWAARRDKLGLRDHIRFRIRPFLRKPSARDWEAFLADLVAEVKADPADLVVMDTISNLWPVVRENDAGEVGAALMPLREINAAQLLVHHLRKADGKEATGSRGSGAILAFVDTIIELRRFNADDHACRRRVLTSWGRDDESQGELVIELNDAGDGYDTQGDKASVTSDDLQQAILKILPLGPPGLTWEAIRDRWPGDTAPRTQTLLNELQKCVDHELWARSGAGKKGSPHSFWKIPPTRGLSAWVWG